MAEPYATDHGMTPEIAAQISVMTPERTRGLMALLLEFDRLESDLTKMVEDFHELLVKAQSQVEDALPDQVVMDLISKRPEAPHQVI